MNEQVFLLLAEVVRSRRALEALERSTAHYAGLAIQAAGTGGLGAPPLQGGALRVYVTNINELTAGGARGVGSVIEGVLGGVGRFLGGVLGGFAGGTLGVVLQPFELHLVSRIVADIGRLAPEITKIIAGANELQSRLGPPKPAREPVESLNSVAPMTKGLEDVNAELGTNPERWLGLLKQVGEVIDGLVRAIPVVLGAFASFLVRLTDVQSALVSLLTFAVENALVLRGLVLLTVFDAVSVAARVAGAILRVLSDSIDTIVGSLAVAVSGGLSGALSALIPLSTALKATIDPLMAWLSNGLGAFLTFLGDTRVFRLAIHLVNQLPVLLPPILLLLDKEMNDQDRDNLRQARHWQMPGAVGPTGGRAPREIAPFPFPAEKIVKETQQGLKDAVALSASAFGHGTKTATDHVLKTLDATATAAKGIYDDRNFNEAFPRELAVLTRQATDLSGEMTTAQRAFAEARKNTSEPLKAIADAFEKWLTGKGYQTLLGTVTDHLKVTGTGTEAGSSIPGRMADSLEASQPAPTVEIGELVVELGAPSRPATEALLSMPRQDDPNERRARGGP